MRAIIGGTSLFKSDMLNGEWDKLGGVPYKRVRGSVLVNRHHGARPPHMVDHRQHMMMLKELGVDEIFGICSVGSMKKGLKLGTFVVPDDYIHFWPPTLFDSEMKHIVPQLDENVRKRLLGALKRLGLKAKDGGVYWEARGPRFETPAEIRMMANFADVVGMTAASEATLAHEAGMRYAFVCTVDNYANGIDGAVSHEKLMQAVAINARNIEHLVAELVR